MSSSKEPSWFKRYFQVELPPPPAMETKVLNKGVITTTHVVHHFPNLGTSAFDNLHAAFNVSFQLRPLHRKGLWCNGQKLECALLPEDSIAIYDMRDRWNVHLDDPFEVMVWYVTQPSLEALADAHCAPRINALECSPAKGSIDRNLRQFANLLIPAVSGGMPSLQLATNHLLLALHEYLAMTYGGLDPRARALQGALSPWQLRRAREFMLENMHEDISLDSVASHCGLSPNHFTRAFKRSTGTTPHRWLMQHRLEAAKDRIRTSAQSIATIAIECGFADQSHLTRNFVQSMGVSPGVWRRLVAQGGPEDTDAEVPWSCKHQGPTSP